MQSLEYGFSQFHDKIKPKAAIVLLNRVDSEDLDKAHSRCKNELAKVFMHCKEYVELKFEEKVSISGFGLKKCIRIQKTKLRLFILISLDTKQSFTLKTAHFVVFHKNLHTF